MSIHRILVPIDGSAPATAALEHAIFIATATGAALDVVTVVDLGQLNFYDGMYRTPEQVDAIETRVKQDVLDGAVATVADRVPATYSVLHGSILPTLLDRVAAAEIDLAVLGRTGKGAVERFFEGSVSRRLATRCPVPVTVVG
jgi:nucleotide-binding universal stress UspA family protein